MGCLPVVTKKNVLYMVTSNTKKFKQRFYFQKYWLVLDISIK